MTADINRLVTTELDQTVPESNNKGINLTYTDDGFYSNRLPVISMIGLPFEVLSAKGYPVKEALRLMRRVISER